jgi:hypothetical protein
MLRIVSGYRNDFAVAIVLIRMAQDRRDQKLGVHHQAAHIPTSPVLAISCSTRH